MSDTEDNDITDTSISQSVAPGNKEPAIIQKNIRVFPLNIMMRTNIPGMSETPLHFNMLYHHDLEKGRYSATKYSLPYFTDSVKYPTELLTVKLYSDRVDFFFNKTRFNKILRKTMVDYVEDTDNSAEDGDADDDELIEKRRQTEIERFERLHENAVHNIQLMLVLLFPVADEFGNVFKTTYEQFILNKPSSELYTVRNIDPVAFLNPSWFPLYNYFAPREYEAPLQEISYIKNGGTKYVVADVVWLNDLINHPIYREFVKTYFDKLQEKRNSGRKLRIELRERKEIFKTLITKYLDYSRTKGNVRNVFKVMIETLIGNVTGNTPERTPNTKYDFGTTASSTGFNAKEVLKRDVIIKMVNYIGAIDDILNGYKGELSGANNHPTNQPITKRNITRILRREEGQQLLEKITDNIVNAYIEYTSYNKTAEGGMEIALKDTTRIITELYNIAILLKALKILNDFVDDKIRRLDLSEKNEDGSDKTKLEIDILKVMNKNYTYYVSLNSMINGSLKNVVEPARRSSNIKLQNFLKQLVKPMQTEIKDSNMLVDIYDKYISSIIQKVKPEYISKYMNVGVCTVISNENSDDKTPREMPEIYVYINVVKKDDYEQSKNRRCIMNDDRIANNLKQILYSNTMLDNTFPEINKYRSYQFLESPTTTDSFTPKETVQPPQPPSKTQPTQTTPTPKPTTTKGGKRKTRKYTSSSLLRRKSRKYKNYRK